MCIFDFLIFTVGYTVARLVFPRVSFHKVYVEPLIRPETGFNALGYRHDGQGRIQIESTVAGFLGFIVCLIVFFAFGLLIQVAA